MPSETNRIATIKSLKNKGIPCQGYTKESECPTYSEFSCPISKNKTIKVDSVYTIVTNSDYTTCVLNKITATLSEKVPYRLILTYVFYTSDPENQLKTVTFEIPANETTYYTWVNGFNDILKTALGGNCLRSVKYRIETPPVQDVEFNIKEVYNITLETKHQSAGS